MGGMSFDRANESLDQTPDRIMVRFIFGNRSSQCSRARTGVVTLIQRFGSALNLNVHLHMIILDGVYTMEHNQPRFHRVNAPARQHLDKLLNRIIARVMRRLIKDGLLVQDQKQPWLDFEETDIIDTLHAASIRYRVAIGPGAGSRTLTLKNPGLQRTETQPKPFTVDRNGFSLNVAVACQGQQRERLERLCRYVTRPAVCLERLSNNAAGQVSYELKHPFRDGTTHILFTPEDFLARLAALVPRPRSNLTRYFLGIGGFLRPTRHSGEQWSLVQRIRHATNQRNRQYRPPLKPLSIKHRIARH